MLSAWLEDPVDWTPLFVAAGVWNIATGFVYLGLRQRIAARYGVGASAGGDPSDRILANLLHVYFGVVAFWIAQDPERDVHLIALWIAAKLTSVGLAAVRHARTPAEQRSSLALAPAATDVVWSAVFLICLVDLVRRGAAA